MRTAGVLALLLLAPPARAADPVDFRKDVYPILHDHCFKCHQGPDAKSGVRLDTRNDVLARLKVGNPAASLVVRLVTSDDPDRMMPPRGKRLTPEQIATLKAWIEQGAKWDDDLLPPDAAKGRHWAFQPVKRPPVPAVRNAGRVRNPIDAFVLAGLEARGLSPAPEADRRTLLRRLALDLTGLPPTPEEIEAFQADTRPDAYERQVERLLASPHYGERWARHWLDAARYADSEGYESDHVRPHAWRYRDWVVAAFNADKPYDRFVLEQLAGDELTPYSDANLTATGFLAAARLSSNEEDKARQLNDVYVDITNATAAAFLGLTFNCAQCHAHKFDPITHADYYRLQGFFLRGMPYNLALRDPGGWKAYEAAKPPEYDPARRLADVILRGAKERLAADARTKLTPEQAAAHDTPPEQRTPEQHRLAVEAGLKFEFTTAQVENAVPAADKPLYAELKKKLAAIEAKLPDPPQTWGFYSPTSPNKVDVLPMRGFYPPPFDARILTRARPFLLLAGDHQRRGPALEPGWPAVLGPTPAGTTTRTALARWLTDPAHPLTARVWANRVWHYHFGRGIVATPNDFGVRGAPPTHPELLDWLAAELVRPTFLASGGRQPPVDGHGKQGADAPRSPQSWSTKHLHRLIVTSATYRQASRNDPAAKADPDNKLLGRWKPRWAEAEAIRDAMLVVSGELDRTVGGKPDPDENKTLRRTLYLLQKRQKPPGFHNLFDAPLAAAESCPVRGASNTPLHALALLNNEFPAARAKAFAARVRKAAGDDRAEQVEAAFRLALGRLPTAAERKAIADFLARAPGEDDPLVLLCHTLLAASEFGRLE